MTLPRSAADVLAGHVLFEIEVIDRMYLNLYQPGCSTALGSLRSSSGTGGTGSLPRR
jgi:hypothetical protein